MQLSRPNGVRGVLLPSQYKVYSKKSLYKTPDSKKNRHKEKRKFYLGNPHRCECEPHLTLENLKNALRTISRFSRVACGMMRLMCTNRDSLIYIYLTLLNYIQKCSQSLVAHDIKINIAVGLFFGAKCRRRNRQKSR